MNETTMEVSRRPVTTFCDLVLQEFQVPQNLPGGVVYILGAPGSGKSHLLRHLLWLQKRTVGRCLFYGAEQPALDSALHGTLICSERKVEKLSHMEVRATVEKMHSLQQPQGERVLVVLENLDMKPEAMRDGFWPELYATAAYLNILIIVTLEKFTGMTVGFARKIDYTFYFYEKDFIGPAYAEYLFYLYHAYSGFLDVRFSDACREHGCVVLDQTSRVPLMSKFRAPFLNLPAPVHVETTSSDADVGTAEATEVLKEIAFAEVQRGPQGVAGRDGAAGLPGPPGELGMMGPPGVSGRDGNPGPPGACGRDGPMGHAGPVGPSGSMGLRGSIGPEGPEGPEGRWGNHGPPGTPGIPGPVGATGLKGSPGVQGEKGEVGLQGMQGEAGLQGAPGAPGLSVDDNLVGRELRRLFDELVVTLQEEHRLLRMRQDGLESRLGRVVESLAADDSSSDYSGDGEDFVVCDAKEEWGTE